MNEFQRNLLLIVTVSPNLLQFIAGENDGTEQNGSMNEWMDELNTNKFYLKHHLKLL